MSSLSLDMPDHDMPAPELFQSNKQPRAALPTSFDNVNNAPMVARRSLGDIVMKKKLPKNTGSSRGLAGFRVASRSNSPRRSILSSPRAGSRHRSPNESPNRPVSQVGSRRRPHQSPIRPLSHVSFSTKANQTQKPQRSKSPAMTQSRNLAATTLKVTTPSVSQSNVPKQTIREVQSPEVLNAREARLPLRRPQLARTDDGQGVDVHVDDRTYAAQRRSIPTAGPEPQPSEAAVRKISDAIAVAKSDISRSKAMGRTTTDALYKLTSQIIGDLETAGLATIQLASTHARSTSSQIWMVHELSEEIANKVKGALSLHEEHMIKRLESHHLGVRNHESKVSNEIKTLTRAETGKIMEEVRGLRCTLRSHNLPRPQVTSPNSGDTGSSGRKRRRTSSSPVVDNNRG